MEGQWIKLHRGIVDWEWFDNANMVKFWLYLLVRANWEDQEWHGMTIPRGSFVTCRERLANEVNMSVQQVRTALEKLVLTNNIVLNVTNKFTMITICKYDTYQLRETDLQPTNNPLNNQQITTIEEDNKEKDKIINYFLYKENSGCENGQKSAPEIPTKKEAEFSMFSGPDDQVIGEHPKSPENGLKTAKELEPAVFLQLQQIWNDKANVAKVISMTEERRNKIRVRWGEWAKIGNPLEVFTEICTKIGQSDHCRGCNNTGWRATIDWILQNERNWAKVYEGNYDNRTPGAPSAGNQRPATPGEVQKDVNSKWQRK